MRMSAIVKIIAIDGKPAALLPIDGIKKQPKKTTRIKFFDEESAKKICAKLDDMLGKEVFAEIVGETARLHEHKYEEEYEKVHYYYHYDRIYERIEKYRRCACGAVELIGYEDHEVERAPLSFRILPFMRCEDVDAQTLTKLHDEISKFAAWAQMMLERYPFDRPYKSETAKAMLKTMQTLLDLYYYCKDRVRA